MKSCVALTLLFVTMPVMAGEARIDATSRPNIILMMGDDHGWEETGYNGHPHVKTPVLDEMAASGLKFERFYAAHPSCSPTRASFLTGRHPNRMGTFAPGWSFRPDEMTIAHVLSRAGYQCAHFGKWHVGAVRADSPVCPGAMGFHTWLSHDNFFELNPTMSRNGQAPERFEGESSEILVREAIQFISQSSKTQQPFLMVIWFGSPHEPYSGLPEDLALYDDLPQKYPRQVALTSNETGEQTRRAQGEVLRERYAEITAMDRAIGTLRSYLKDTGRRDNTLLFYCGDNGTSGDAALREPHRGVKGQVYEGGILVPGIIEWPAVITQPRSTSVRASTSDLMPTLCEVVEQPLPKKLIDGSSLGFVLRNEPGDRPTPLYFWEYNPARLMASSPQPTIDPKLQEGTTPLAKKMGNRWTRNFQNFVQTDIQDSDYRGPRAIIDGGWKLVIHNPKNDDARKELFDLSSDPAEKHSLTSQHPERVQAMELQLRDWQTSVLQDLTETP